MLSIQQIRPNLPRGCDYWDKKIKKTTGAIHVQCNTVALSRIIIAVEKQQVLLIGLRVRACVRA